MATCTFETTDGVKGRTRSRFRFVVVDRATAEIEYRTDDRQRAIGRAREIGYRRRAGADVIDTLMPGAVWTSGSRR